MRTGTTLIEIGVTVGILGLMAGLTFPRFGSYRDRIAVDGGDAPLFFLGVSLTAFQHERKRSTEECADKSGQNSKQSLSQIRAPTGRVA